jgi:hypothetical protein
MRRVFLKKKKEREKKIVEESSQGQGFVNFPVWVRVGFLCEKMRQTRRKRKGNIAKPRLLKKLNQKK